MSNSAPAQPPLIISVQSQVVYGHVGNSAALFPMQAAGLEVAPIPTVIFSNTPNHPTLRGRALPADFFADLLRGAAERDLHRRAAFIVSGYIGSAEVAELTAGFITRAKEVNPDLIYLCDPVLGDSGPGLYVPEDIAAIMRDQLLPLADLATPNPFELGWLTGVGIRRTEDLHQAAALLRMAPGAQLIATGCQLDDTPADMIESVILSPTGLSRHPVRHLPVYVAGTGDLFAGLITTGLARGLTLPRAVEMGQHLTSLALTRARDLGTKEIVLTDPDFLAQLLKLGQQMD